MDTNDLATRQTISGMVDAYREAIQLVEDGYAKLFQAKAMLNAAFGEHYSDFSTLHEREYGDQATVTTNVKNRLKVKAWKQIIARLNLRKIMTQKDYDTLDSRLSRPENVPDLEVSVIMDIIVGLSQNAPEYRREVIRTAYAYLMRGQNWNDRYKTNAANARNYLGKKVIIQWAIQSSYTPSMPFRVRYGDTSESLLNLDKAFHLLDGKGVPDGYRGPLEDAINTSRNGEGETEYFKFRAYLNGNLHLEFKRLDLVRRLNLEAGNASRIGD